MTDTLFDPFPYGPATSRRTRRTPPPQIKLRGAWVLTRSQGRGPVAHLPFRRYYNQDQTPMIVPVCDHRHGLTVLSVSGEPLVDACPQCFDLE